MTVEGQLVLYWVYRRLIRPPSRFPLPPPFPITLAADRHVDTQRQGSPPPQARLNRHNLGTIGGTRVQARVSHGVCKEQGRRVPSRFDCAYRHPIPPPSQALQSPSVPVTIAVDRHVDSWRQGSPLPLPPVPIAPCTCSDWTATM